AGESWTLADGREVRILADRKEVLSMLAAETATAARAAVAEKGAFSLCIPGGLGPADGKEASSAQIVYEALASLVGQDLNFSKWHVFFAGERLDSQESYLMAKKLWLDASGIPTDQ
ncbi:unnamed protein product, partial [Polarella glacialis]